MMLFSELYGAYYNVVAEVLKAACDHPVSRAELRRIMTAKAFGESALSIEPALLEERWQLLDREGRTPLAHVPTMPLTLLQKRWLKALSLDPRIRLFPEGIPVPEGVEPLFGPEEIRVFDRYTDGDPYEDEAYIRHFRCILAALRERTPLRIESTGGKGGVLRRILMPERLEYSEKDDKFRLIGSGSRYGLVVNLGRILRCEPLPGRTLPAPGTKKPRKRQTVTLEVWDGRNALERVMLHFAHFEKEAEKLDDRRYRVTLNYDREDETEMVIRVLSFGPLVRVTGPDSFAGLIRDRLLRQKNCF